MTILFYFLLFDSAIDEGLGKEACARLESEGLGNIKYHPLDVTDAESIQRLADHFRETYGGLDVLVSNAGISFKVAGEDQMSFERLLSSPLNSLPNSDRR